MIRLGILLLLLACNADRGPRWREYGAPSPRTGGTLRFAVSGNVNTLDPAIAYDEVTSYALHPLLDTLVDHDHESRLIPRLAERWQVSPDGLTYTFWLRPGLRYSDGQPIVAADVVYALTRVLQTPDSPYPSFLADVVGTAEVVATSATTISGITVRGDRELEIRLARANAAFLAVLTMPFTAPMRADHVERAGESIRRRPLSSGPYLLREWDEGRRVVLDRNPHYHDKARQRLDTIVMLEHVPRETQLLMFERGELDSVSRPSSPDLLWLEDKRSGWQPYLHARAQLGAYGSRMNVRRKPFDDRRVRQAFNYALNKQHTVKVLNGRATPAHGILPPGALGRDETLAPYPHDPAKARALLAEAGYAHGLTVEYVTFADEDADKLALLLQRDLAAVGVTVTISRMTFATWASVVGNADGPPFSIATWVGDGPDPTAFLDPKFHSRAIATEASSNDSFYANPALDTILDAARGEGDAATRAALYRQADRIVHEDAPWIWNYHEVVTEVTQPYVRGYAPHPIWVRDYTTAWLDLGPDGARVPR